VAAASSDGRQRAIAVWIALAAIAIDGAAAPSTGGAVAAAEAMWHLGPAVRDAAALAFDLPYELALLPSIAGIGASAVLRDVEAPRPRFFDTASFVALALCLLALHGAIAGFAAGDPDAYLVAAAGLLAFAWLVVRETVLARDAFVDLAPLRSKLVPFVLLACAARRGRERRSCGLCDAVVFRRTDRARCSARARRRAENFRRSGARGGRRIVSAFGEKLVREFEDQRELRTRVRDEREEIQIANVAVAVLERCIHRTRLDDGRLFPNRRKLGRRGEQIVEQRSVARVAESRRRKSEMRDHVSERRQPIRFDERRAQAGRRERHDFQEIVRGRAGEAVEVVGGVVPRKHLEPSVVEVHVAVGKGADELEQLRHRRGVQIEKLGERARRETANVQPFAR
jgi:hypothetical protein